MDIIKNYKAMKTASKIAIATDDNSGIKVTKKQFNSDTGEALDELAFNMYGFTRRPASKADSLAIERNVYFYAPDGSVFGDINGGQDIILPRGTRISNNEFFETNDTSLSKIPIAK